MPINRALFFVIVIISAIVASSLRILCWAVSITTIWRGNYNKALYNNIYIYGYTANNGDTHDDSDIYSSA